MPGWKVFLRHRTLLIELAIIWLPDPGPQVLFGSTTNTHILIASSEAKKKKFATLWKNLHIANVNGALGADNGTMCFIDLSGKLKKHNPTFSQAVPETDGVVPHLGDAVETALKAFNSGEQVHIPLLANSELINLSFTSR